MVLGANDGIVSTASLIVGGAAASGRSEVLIAGVAGPAAGQAAEALHAQDPLAAHVRDGLGIFGHVEALPLARAALVPQA